MVILGGEQQESKREGSLDDRVGKQGTWLSLLFPPMQQLPVPQLQWPRGCSWLSLWKKLLPNS